MKAHNFKTNLFIALGEDGEVELELDCNYYPGCRGARDSCGGIRGAGPPLEPDDPPEIEILEAINVATGKKIDLTDDEEERVLEKLWQKVDE